MLNIIILRYVIASLIYESSAPANKRIGLANIYPKVAITKEIIDASKIPALKVLLAPV